VRGQRSGPLTRLRRYEQNQRLCVPTVTRRGHSGLLLRVEVTLPYRHISSEYKQAAVARLPSFGKMIDDSEVLQILRLEIPSLFHPENLQ